jgi:hypothetical protein
MLRKVWVSLPFGILLVGVLYINIKLYCEPQVKIIAGDSVNMDVVGQLHFLKEKLDNGAAEDMQELYPEGYIFMQALYALTWSDVAQTLNLESPLYKEALSEADSAIHRLYSDKARNIFNRATAIPNGAYYAGWTTYVSGRKLALLPRNNRAARDIQKFQQQCDAMARVLEKEVFPESYRGQAWPADAMLCAASLALHDKLFTPRYRTTLQQWTIRLKSNLDERGMIPHAAGSAPMARGSSMSLMLIFLKGIDPVFARQQFALYKKYFVTTRLGLVAIREYPQGVDGDGDVDSGPVLFQAGAAASIVGVRTLTAYGEYGAALSLRNAIEAFGFSVKGNQEKHYLYGMLPMADAFIAWTNAADKTNVLSRSAMPGRNTFHAYSAGLAVLLLCALVVLNRTIKK